MFISTNAVIGLTEVVAELMRLKEEVTELKRVGIQWNLRREDTMGMGILSSLWRLSSFRGSCFAHAQGRFLLLGLSVCSS